MYSIHDEFEENTLYSFLIEKSCLKCYTDYEEIGIARSCVNNLRIFKFSSGIYLCIYRKILYLTIAREVNNTVNITQNVEHVIECC